jgi:sugar-specific transcriptional regulator TrmB
MIHASTFEKIGLNAGEAQVYCACLQLGTASVAELAKKSALKRPTTYLVVDELLTKGLLVKVPRGKKMFVRAEDPGRLLTLMDEKRAAALKALPELQALASQCASRPKVEFYEGKEQLIKVYEAVYRSKEIWAVASMDDYFKVFTYEENRHLYRLLKNHSGKIYDMFVYSRKAARIAAQPHREGLGEVRVLPKDFQISSDILAGDDRVVLVSLLNMSATVIIDPTIVDTERRLLQYIWQSIG